MRSIDRRVRRGGRLSRSGSRGVRPGAERLEGRELLTITNVASNPVPLTAVNVPLTNFALGTFNDDPGTDHIVLIDWGDGGDVRSPDVSQATIVEAPGQDDAPSTYTIEGTHTYIYSGDFQIKINVLGGDGQSIWTSTTAAIVADFGGLPVPNTVAGTQIDKLPIAALSYNAGIVGGEFVGYYQTNNYYVPINWGDGTGGIGNLRIGYGAAHDASQPGDTPYIYVDATHTYTTPGTYTVQINAIGGPGQSIWASTSITVNAPSGIPSAVPFTAMAGTPAKDIPLAGLTAPAGTSPVAAVDWGDGSAPTFATLVADATPALGGGTAPGTTAYTVEGSHTYASPGQHTVLVNVIEGRESLWTSARVTVDPGLSPVAGAPVSGVAGLALGNIPLADFAGPASGTLVAAIAWGDGSTPSFGTVVASATPAKSPSAQKDYVVVGSHKYAAPGSYTALINVIAPDGESRWGWTTVTIR